MRDIEFHKKRRRVTKASLTKLSTKLTELEANPDALRIVQGLTSKLKTLDAEFKTHQLAIIDLTDDDDDGLAAEQQELDDHDDRASELTIRIQRLISALSPSTILEL